MTEASPEEINEHAGLILLDPEQYFDAQDKHLAAGSSERIPFRGGLTCSCVVTSYPLLEVVMLIRGRIGSNLDAYQFGYRTDVSASAGTHAGGGNTDIGQFQDADLAVERECGWTFQHRTQAQGFSMDHCHGAPFGCTHLSPGGHAQQIDWENGRNGLASHGPITGSGPTGRNTPHWQDGVKHMRGIILSFQQDIINALKPELDAIQNKVNGLDNKDDIALRVWNKQVVPTPDNKSTWAAGSYVNSLWRHVQAAEHVCADINNKLDALTAAVAALKAGQK